MTQHRSWAIFWVAGVLAAGVIGGCRDAAAPVPQVTGIQLARNGSTAPAVTGTDPTGAPQDTTLDVEVQGSGFDDGSTVQLTLAGVPTTKVLTNFTRYRNPRRLIANITIAADADLDLYDVEVTTTNRKKGIGSEMFEVFAGGGNSVLVEFVRPASPAVASFFADVATLDFTSAAQPLQGTMNRNSVQTNLTPFTLGFESLAGFADGKNPKGDPLCDTEWFEIMLDAAAANGGSLDGVLQVAASWNNPRAIDLYFYFITAIDGWEYLLNLTNHGWQEDRLVLSGADTTTLAMRHGYPNFYRRQLGPNAGTLGGSWDGIQLCLINSDGSNGFIDAEIRVSMR